MTVVQRLHTFLGSWYLRNICVNHRLLFGLLTRFDGSDELSSDRNLVKRWHRAIHDYPKHDLAGERVCIEIFYALYVVVVESSNGVRDQPGLQNPRESLSTLTTNKVEVRSSIMQASTSGGGPPSPSLAN